MTLPNAVPKKGKREKRKPAPLPRMRPKKMEAFKQAHGGRLPGSTITAAKQPVKKVNEERQAKRRKEYRRKLAQFRRSPVYREVIARANGRCEGKFLTLSSSPIPTFGVIGTRCEGTERLQVHHVGYQGFGGSESADKLVVLCYGCHAAIERHLRPWKRQQWKSSRFQFAGQERGV